MLRLRVFEVILIFICSNKMSGGNKYFFRPRKGENYSQGFNGLKTLVVGAYHFCWEAHAGSYGCTYYDRCVREGRSREFDDLCPIYKSRMDLYDGYYRISNSNIIEIDSYTEGERCPSYGEFTHFMTGIRGRIITMQERLDFWNSVAFYNYIQHFLPEAEDFSYQERKSVLDADFPAFMQVLEELEPDVIYIWTDAVKDAVFSNAHRLGGMGLKLMGNHSVGSMSVWEVAVSYDGKFPILPALQNRKKRVRYVWYRKFLMEQMKLTETGLIDRIAAILYNAPDIVYVMENGPAPRIECRDRNSDKVVRLIYEIRQAVRDLSSNKNRLTYKDIQDMLHTDIPNIEKRISDLNLKHRRRRG